MREIEKTCENCEYEYEDLEGVHCRHCIRNAEEHFEPKKQNKLYKEIRNKTIDEFAEVMKDKLQAMCNEPAYQHTDEDYFVGICSAENVIDEIAEQMKGSE